MYFYGENYFKYISAKYKCYKNHLIDSEQAEHSDIWMVKKAKKVEVVRLQKKYRN